MTDDLTGGLDLLGDWLDAKGYGEEAGLCTRVMDHMHKQDARIAELEATHREDEVYRVAAADAVESMRARIAALEAALKECVDDLEAEIDSRYRILPGGSIHGAMLADYERDMATVRQARKLVEGR